MLRYKFTSKKEVDLLSTYVPESFRGKGVAALLSKVNCHDYGIPFPPPQKNVKAQRSQKRVLLCFIYISTQV